MKRRSFTEQSVGILGCLSIFKRNAEPAYLGNNMHGRLSVSVKARGEKNMHAYEGCLLTSQYIRREVTMGWGWGMSSMRQHSRIGAGVLPQMENLWT